MGKSLLMLTRREGDVIVIDAPNKIPIELHNLILNKYVNEKDDIILNPFDARASTWNLFDEVKNEGLNLNVD